MPQVTISQLAIDAMESIVVIEQQALLIDAEIRAKVVALGKLQQEMSNLITQRDALWATAHTFADFVDQHGRTDHDQLYTAQAIQRTAE